MSAANRGAVRAPLDYYETPRWTVEAIEPHVPRDGVILDAGAGTGAIASVLADWGRCDRLRLVCVGSGARGPMVDPERGRNLTVALYQTCVTFECMPKYSNMLVWQIAGATGIDPRTVRSVLAGGGSPATRLAVRSALMTLGFEVPGHLALAVQAPFRS
jgi:hypothetical protein